MTDKIFGARFIFNGLNFGPTGLTPTISYLKQMQSYGSLQGLYLMLDAVNGTPYPNAKDYSGNGKTAIARSSNGYNVPVGAVGGVAVTPGASIATSGSIYDTPIPIDNVNGFTRIWSGKQLVSPVALTTQAGFALSGSNISFPTVPGNITTATGHGPTQEILITTAANIEQWNFADNTPSAAIFNGASQTTGSNKTPTENYHVDCMRMNIPALTYSHDSEGGVSTNHNSAMGSSAAAQFLASSNHSFGFTFSSGANVANLPAGIINGFAVYSGALSDANAAAAIVTMQRIMEQSGLSI